jgi:hypothetical protein
VLVPAVLGSEADDLLDRIVARRSDFYENEPGRMAYRHGWALAGVDELTEPIAAVVRSELDGWCRELGIDIGDAKASTALELSDVAVTAFLAGDFIGPHIDDGRASRPNGRVISFVYWLHRRPRRFSAGELRLCGWALHEGKLVAAPPAVDLDPTHDTLVAFPSSTMHEVFPVQSPSDDFGDARFTITGFVRRRAATPGPRTLPTTGTARPGVSSRAAP